jgi:hypothetical protein
VGSYYYLGAQLPYLVYGQDIPMSSEVFKTLARENMGSSDAALLDYCTLDPDPADTAASSAAYAEPAPRTASAFINNFKEWERALRLNLARNRALKLNRDFNMDTPDYPIDAAAAAKNALAIESPLEAEIFLDKARWDVIENNQGLNTFSENAMFAYLFKLLLMERRAAFKTDEGFSEYKALYTAILGEAK